MNNIAIAEFRTQTKALLRLGGPLIVNNLAVAGMQFADAVMAGSLGARELAAVAVGGSVWFICFTLCLGILTKAGFERPILHGLASFGVAARALLDGVGVEDSAALASFGVRFSAPVYPGEIISTSVWEEAGGFVFRSRVAARDVIVLNNGRAEFH